MSRNRLRLIAAIGEVRAKLALLESRIEDDDDEAALGLLEEIEATWTDAMERLRS